MNGDRFEATLKDFYTVHSNLHAVNLVQDKQARSNFEQRLLNSITAISGSSSAKLTIMPRFRTLPPQETRDEITNQTEALVNAIKGHPCYAPPWPAQGIGYVLDAVERTHYILTELSNIRDEKQVRYPEQIPTNNIDNNTFDYPPRQKQAPGEFLRRSLI